MKQPFQGSAQLDKFEGHAKSDDQPINTQVGIGNARGSCERSPNLELWKSMDSRRCPSFHQERMGAGLDGPDSHSNVPILPDRSTSGDTLIDAFVGGSAITHFSHPFVR